MYFFWVAAGKSSTTAQVTGNCRGAGPRRHPTAGGSASGGDELQSLLPLFSQALAAGYQIRCLANLIPMPGGVGALTGHRAGLAERGGAIVPGAVRAVGDNGGGERQTFH